MSTTPQRMIAWRSIPRFNSRQLFLAITATAALMWTYRQSLLGSDWAIAVLYGLGSLCLLLTVVTILALVAWIPSRIITGNLLKQTGNPFADGQLPPAMTRASRETAE